MNTARNSVRLIGNLGNDPDVRSLDSGKKVARLNLATTNRYTNQQGEKVEDTCWHTLVAWGKTAEIAEKFLTKGSEIAVEGRLSNNNYTDKQGIKRYNTEIIVNDLQMLGGRKSG